MNPESKNVESAAPAAEAVTPAVVSAPQKATQPVARSLLLALGAAVLLALLLSIMLWQRLSATQEQLARQSADSGAHAVEARTMARQAQDQTRELAARLAVMEARLSEVALQRTQLEELMQSLSRSRDENLVVDIESSIRLAQQQAQLTGSVEPLLAALKARGFSDAEIGTHAGLADTSLALASDPALVHAAQLAKAPKPGPADGVTGDPRRATRALGELGTAQIIQTSVAGIAQLTRRPR